MSNIIMMLFKKKCIYLYMLWFNFFLGSKQEKIKFKPRIKLNHNIYNDVTGQLPEFCFFQKSYYLHEYTTYVYIM